MAGIKTDNSYMADKVYLRLGHLPDKGIVSVLDCYSGSGIIWRGVARLTQKKIRRIPMDEKDDVGFHLPGDNLKYLKTMELGTFDVIDLDAYGIPYEQMKLIREKNYQGVVFVTFIQSMYGGVPTGLLCDIGFTKEMINKTPALFNRRGWDYFLQWLGGWGITEIYHRTHARKHYLYFNCAGVSASGYGNPKEETAASPS
jgi:hypothetical protein